MDSDGKCIERETLTLEGENIGSIEIAENISLLLISDGMVEEEIGNYFCQLFWNKGGTYSVANLKNEYVRAKKRYPYVIKILPGNPSY